MPLWCPRAAAPHPSVFLVILFFRSKQPAHLVPHHLMEVARANIQNSLRLPSITRTDMRRMSFLESTPSPMRSSADLWHQIPLLVMMRGQCLTRVIRVFPYLGLARSHHVDVIADNVCVYDQGETANKIKFRVCMEDSPEGNRKRTQLASDEILLALIYNDFKGVHNIDDMAKETSKDKRIAQLRSSHRKRVS